MTVRWRSRVRSPPLRHRPRRPVARRRPEGPGRHPLALRERPAGRPAGRAAHRLLLDPDHPGLHRARLRCTWPGGQTQAEGRLLGRGLPRSRGRLHPVGPRPAARPRGDRQSRSSRRVRRRDRQAVAESLTRGDRAHGPPAVPLQDAGRGRGRLRARCDLPSGVARSPSRTPTCTTPSWGQGHPGRDRRRQSRTTRATSRSTGSSPCSRRAHMDRCPQPDVAHQRRRRLTRSRSRLQPGGLEHRRPGGLLQDLHPRRLPGRPLQRPDATSSSAPATNPPSTCWKTASRSSVRRPRSLPQLPDHDRRQRPRGVPERLHRAGRARASGTAADEHDRRSERRRRSASRSSKSGLDTVDERFGSSQVPDQRPGQDLPGPLVVHDRARSPWTR